ncbi:twin-arginine translocase TatA/TatE family subunit [Acidisoma cellulosilytica]|uniref:Sec-independent protein translocase protein TatA n=1 Tax=Acidisoma cellulosilyticum TaxID=2802395 RepID=A0A963YZC9_9PROT|nr:twin-arginine translocase TatA/TatE family subunit [Acidisoma cellulosilyticum]MCB8879147.1 twin-arginine translocase TatA/TatE family subunit [Acidisoma cellulosilyticum]
MGSLSIWHWLIVIVVLLLLFGSGKVSHLMGDFAKGIKSFKKNMAEDDDASMAADGKKQSTLSAPGADATAAKRETTSVHSQG